MAGFFDIYGIPLDTRTTKTGADVSVGNIQLYAQVSLLPVTRMLHDWSQLNILQGFLSNEWQASSPTPWSMLFFLPLSLPFDFSLFRRQIRFPTQQQIGTTKIDSAVLYCMGFPSTPQGYPRFLEYFLNGLGPVVIASNVLSRYPRVNKLLKFSGIVGKSVTSLFVFDADR